MFWPVIYAAPSDTKNAAVFAISSIDPGLFMGMELRISSDPDSCQ
ncbi:hypothetical protein C900_01073 [Fulvivirga imtechensis AK7]|uniref:Uncharacterized protein n=1 Tax=Fulvivirga imtechensis AK7 TaxID=1237149 RepID=L8JYH0_9BACT|nr:hypothetical protein C900_01073 [Fulvivirga imtechensis AK7]